jgi:tubby-related protein 1
VALAFVVFCHSFRLLPVNRRYLAQGNGDLNIMNVSDDDDDLDDTKMGSFVLRKKESMNSLRRFPAPREARPYRAPSKEELMEEPTDNNDGGSVGVGSVRSSRASEAAGAAPSFRPKMIPRKSFESLRTSRDSYDEMEKSYKSQSNSWVTGGTSSSVSRSIDFESTVGENKENGSAWQTSKPSLKNKDRHEDYHDEANRRPERGTSRRESDDSDNTSRDDANKSAKRSDPTSIEEDDNDSDVIEIDVLKQAQEREAKTRSKNVLKDSAKHGQTPPRNQQENGKNSSERKLKKVPSLFAEDAAAEAGLPRKSGRYDDEDHSHKGMHGRNSSEWEQLVSDFEVKNSNTVTKPVVPFALQANVATKTAMNPNGMVRCFIVRDRSTYELYLEEPTKKLIAVATKMSLNRTSNYHLFDMTRGQIAGSKLSKKSGNYLGKLRAHDSNRTQYSLLTNATQREEIAGICFDPISTMNFLKEGSQPRKMLVAVPHLDYHKCPIANKVREDDESTSLSNILRKGVFTNRAMCFQNKEPVLENGTYRLNFQGRVTKPSVKNFQLVPLDQPDNVVCQFGKVGDDRFNLDFKAPICPLQAFSFALCQFNL